MRMAKQPKATPAADAVKRDILVFKCAMEAPCACPGDAKGESVTSVADYSELSAMTENWRHVFSDMWEGENLTVWGVRYRTHQHALQAAKFRSAGLLSVAQRFEADQGEVGIGRGSAQQAHKAGRLWTLTANQLAMWDAARGALKDQIYAAKYKEGTLAARALLATRHALLINDGRVQIVCTRLMERRAALRGGGAVEEAQGAQATEVTTPPVAPAPRQPPLKELAPLAHNKASVFVVRHGERIDETHLGAQWMAANRDRWFDPPLTAPGRAQASQAAAGLKELLLGRHGGKIPFKRIYSSTLVRALQTAEQYALVFGLKVCPVPALACCAAAIKQHGPKAPLLAWAEAQAACPDAELEEYREYEPPQPGMCNKRSGGARYQHAMEQLAIEAAREPAQAAAGSAGSGASADDDGDVDCGCSVLVITHREGLRDLSGVAGQPFRRTSYCCTAVFECTENQAEYGEPPSWALVAAPEDFKSQSNFEVGQYRRQLKVGEQVQACDGEGEWCPATVLALNGDDGTYNLQFTGAGEELRLRRQDICKTADEMVAVLEAEPKKREGQATSAAGGTASFDPRGDDEENTAAPAVDDAG
jgi:hypothetical protein